MGRESWRGFGNAMWAVIPVAVLYMVLLGTGLLPYWASLPSCLFCGLVVGMAGREWEWRPWK